MRPPEPSDTATTERWASVDEVARHLGVRKESVYRWIDSRQMPARRVGRLWKFKFTEIDEWVRAGGAAGGQAHHRVTADPSGNGG